MDDFREPETRGSTTTEKVSLLISCSQKHLTKSVGPLGILLTSRQYVTLEMMQYIFPGMKLHSLADLLLMVRLNREGHTTFWS